MAELMQTLREIKALQKRPDGLFGSFMTRPVSHVVAYVSMKLRLSPNAVSFLSFVFCVAAIAALYAGFPSYAWWVAAALFWWTGGILDAADGDLARYTKTGSPFGGWFDSFLDRMKEMLIFAAFGYLAFKQYGNELFLLLGFASIFSNVISGWVSDTKKLFITERTPEIQFSSKYSFGMVDTRDFFVILSLFAFDLRIALFVYSTVFMLLLCMQVVRFMNKYGKRV